MDNLSFAQDGDVHAWQLQHASFTAVEPAVPVETFRPVAIRQPLPFTAAVPPPGAAPRTWWTLFTYVAAAMAAVAMARAAFTWWRARQPEVVPARREVKIFVMPKDPEAERRHEEARREDLAAAGGPAPQATPFAPPPRPAPVTAPNWTTYKFFRLNPSGIIELARESAHSDIDAALSYARSFGGGQSVEIWAEHTQIALVS